MELFHIMKKPMKSFDFIGFSFGIIAANIRIVVSRNISFKNVYVVISIILKTNFAQLRV